MLEVAPPVLISFETAHPPGTFLLSFLGEGDVQITQSFLLVLGNQGRSRSNQNQQFIFGCKLGKLS